MREFSGLVAILDFEDEWPTRVVELIVNLAAWYAAHPALANYEEWNKSIPFFRTMKLTFIIS